MAQLDMSDESSDTGSSSDASSTSSSSAESVTLFHKVKQRLHEQEQGPRLQSAQRSGTQQKKTEQQQRSEIIKNHERLNMMIPAPREQNQTSPSKHSMQEHHKGADDQPSKPLKRHASKEMELPPSVKYIREVLQRKPADRSPTSLSSSGHRGKTAVAAEDAGTKKTSVAAAEDTSAKVHKSFAAKLQQKPLQKPAFTGSNPKKVDKPNLSASTANDASAAPSGSAHKTSKESKESKKSKRSRKKSKLNSEAPILQPAAQAVNKPQETHKLVKANPLNNEAKGLAEQDVEAARSSSAAEAKIKLMQGQMKEMKAAIKDVVEHGSMLSADNHGKLGAAVQVLRAKLQSTWD